MYHDDTTPPHFHAVYAGQDVEVRIAARSTLSATCRLEPADSYARVAELNTAGVGRNWGLPRIRAPKENRRRCYNEKDHQSKSYHCPSTGQCHPRVRLRGWSVTNVDLADRLRWGSAFSQANGMRIISTGFQVDEIGGAEWPNGAACWHPSSCSRYWRHKPPHRPTRRVGSNRGPALNELELRAVHQGIARRGRGLRESRVPSQFVVDGQPLRQRLWEPPLAMIRLVPVSSSSGRRLTERSPWARPLGSFGGYSNATISTSSWVVAPDSTVTEVGTRFAATGYDAAFPAPQRPE